MYWLYRSPRRQRLILGAILVMMIGVISIYIYTHLEAVGQRFSDISESAMESGKIGSGRGSLWKVAFRTYASYSLFGKLFGGGYDTATAFFQGKTIGTHNTYLHILLWAGAAGLYLYLWTFISLWRQMKSATQSDYVPFIIANTVIITYLVAEMTNGVIYYMYVTTFLSFLVGGALGYYKAKENAMPG